MRTIAIGEAGEYGNRLVRFLESHLPREVHIMRFTEPETFTQKVPQDAFCIVAEDFAQLLEKDYESLVLLGEHEDDRTFCRYHSPAKLVEWINKYLEKEVDERSVEDEEVHLVAIYSPIYLSGLEQIAMHYMEEGNLCIGMEDLGKDGERPNMGDLCYYIHLRKNDMTEQIQKVMELRQERYFVDSPGLYYDLADLDIEDLRWFFDQLRNMSGYRFIYVLLGNSAVRNVEIFRSFDQIIMVNKKNHRKLNQFWKYFPQVLSACQIQPKNGLSTIYREEIR